jgi:DnaJ-class molecular chaperone
MTGPYDLDETITADMLCEICNGVGDPGVGVICPRCGGSGLEPRDEDATAA